MRLRGREADAAHLCAALLVQNELLEFELTARTLRFDLLTFEGKLPLLDLELLLSAALKVVLALAVKAGTLGLVLGALLRQQHLLPLILEGLHFELALRRALGVELRPPGLEVLAAEVLALGLGRAEGRDAASLGLRAFFQVPQVVHLLLPLLLLALKVAAAALGVGEAAGEHLVVAPKLLITPKSVRKQNRPLLVKRLKFQILARWRRDERLRLRAGAVDGEGAALGDAHLPCHHSVAQNNAVELEDLHLLRNAAAVRQVLLELADGETRDVPAEGHLVALPLLGVDHSHLRRGGGHA